MKVGLIGWGADHLRPLLEARGVDVVEASEAPELIVTYGGDGTLIGAEREHPGVPKLGIRDSRNTIKCAEHHDELVMERLVQGALVPTKLMKITAEVRGREMRGMNDIILRNRDIRSSVRFAIAVNGESFGDETIGDGLVIATPFGSSAYFRSITHTTLRTGIGLAYNNCTEFVNHLVLREDDLVTVSIVRGPAELTADNDPEVLALEGREVVTIRRSSKRAVVLGVDILRCGRCRYAHAPRRRF